MDYSQSNRLSVSGVERGGLSADWRTAREGRDVKRAYLEVAAAVAD